MVHGEVYMSKSDYELAARTYSIKGYRKKKKSLLAVIVMIIAILCIVAGGVAFAIFYLGL
jgi:hypothetical protein